MRISDWSSDVCSSDLRQDRPEPHHRHQVALPAPARHRRQARALPGPDSVYGQPQHLNASSRREDTDFLPLQGEGFKHESRPFGQLKVAASRRSRIRSTTMELILLQKVTNPGTLGDQVHVKNRKKV